MNEGFLLCEGCLGVADDRILYGLEDPMLIEESMAVPLFVIDVSPARSSKETNPRAPAIPHRHFFRSWFFVPHAFTTGTRHL